MPEETMQSAEYFSFEWLHTRYYMYKQDRYLWAFTWHKAKIAFVEKYTLISWVLAIIGV